MKKLLFLLMMLSISSAAHSAEAEKEGACDAVDYLSGQIMTGRQDGVSMRDMMSEITKEIKNTSVTEHAKRLVIEAYSSRRMSSKKGKAEAIVEFRNKHYLACIQT